MPPLPNSRGSLLGVFYSRNETWLSLGSSIYLQQGKEAGDSHPKLCLLEGTLSHCLYTVFGYLHVDFFFAVG